MFESILSWMAVEQLLHPSILIFPLVSLLGSVAIFLFVRWRYGPMTPSVSMLKFIEFVRHGPLIGVVSLIIVAAATEEILFRFLFVGVPSMFIGEPWMIWSLAVVGLILFGLAHLPNYRDGERRVARCFPQMWGGIIFIGAFVTAGLGGAVLVHALHNLTLVSIERIAAGLGRA